MKPVIIIAIAFVFMLIVFPFLNPSYAQINNQKKTASATETISIGPVDVQFTYSLDFDITMPKKITAGNTEEVRVTPSNGRLETTIFFEGQSFGPYPTPINLGQEKDIAKDVPLLTVYAKPVITARPQISGPANISPQSLSFTSMTPKTVQIHVNNNIGNSNSVNLQIPITLSLEVGAGIDYYIGTKSYPVETFEISRFTTISNSIPLEKLVNTKLNLEINDSSRSEHIKVKPIVTSDKGTLYNYSVKIYVDDRLKQTVQSSSWSGDVWIGYGTHTIKAEFSQTNDKSNSAIIYLDSIDFESHSLIKPTSKSESICGAGTIMKDGLCVVDTTKQESEKSSKGGGCLIATATYGTELAPQVQQLRELRDNQLLQTKSGTSFMKSFNDFYYSFSPIIADYERENPIFKEAVKLVITPMISSLSILNYVDMDSEVEVLRYGISLIVLNLAMYVGIPASVIVGIKKKF